MLPAGAPPERPATGVIRCNQDYRSLDTDNAQTDQTFVHQTFTHSQSLISRFDREMINVPASTIVAAKCGAHDDGPCFCDPA